MGEVSFGTQTGGKMVQLCPQIPFRVTCLLQVGTDFRAGQQFPQTIFPINVDEKRRGMGACLEHVNTHAPGVQVCPPFLNGAVHSPGIRLHPAEQVGRFESGHDRRTLGDESSAKISVHGGPSCYGNVYRQKLVHTNQQLKKQATNASQIAGKWWLLVG